MINTYAFLFVLLPALLAKLSKAQTTETIQSCSDNEVLVSIELDYTNEMLQSYPNYDRPSYVLALRRHINNPQTRSSTPADYPFPLGNEVYSSYAGGVMDVPDRVYHCVPADECVVLEVGGMPREAVEVQYNGEQIPLGPSFPGEWDQDISTTTTQMGPCTPLCNSYAEGNQADALEIAMWTGVPRPTWTLTQLSAPDQNQDDNFNLIYNCTNREECATMDRYQENFVVFFYAFCVPKDTCFRLVTADIGFNGKEPYGPNLNISLDGQPIDNRTAIKFDITEFGQCSFRNATLSNVHNCNYRSDNGFIACEYQTFCEDKDYPLQCFDDPFGTAVFPGLRENLNPLYNVDNCRVMEAQCCQPDNDTCQLGGIDTKLSAGAIGGVVVAAIVVVIILIILAMTWPPHKRPNRVEHRFETGRDNDPRNHPLDDKSHGGKKTGRKHDEEPTETRSI